MRAIIATAFVLLSSATYAADPYTPPADPLAGVHQRHPAPQQPATSVERAMGDELVACVREKVALRMQIPVKATAQPEETPPAAPAPAAATPPAAPPPAQ